MIFKDYYKILEFDTNSVTLEQIKAAFRELAKKYHPDINTSNPYAEEHFKDINEAYRVLSDRASRRKYDRMWKSNIGRKRREYEESSRESDSLFSDFFHLFFGNIDEEKKNTKKQSKKVPVKGDNIETQIDLSIQEAFYGIEKKISLRAIDGKMKTFSIKVPAGIRNGEKIRLIGQGKEGENGGKNGDLFIKIDIQDTKKYRLLGCDIETDLYLTPWEAALGTRVNVDSIQETSTIYVPQGIQSGEKVRLTGKGYKNGKGGRGDLIAEVKIMIPKKLTKQEQGIYEQLKEISKFDPRNQDNI